MIAAFSLLRDSPNDAVKFSFRAVICCVTLAVSPAKIYISSRFKAIFLYMKCSTIARYAGPGTVSFAISMLTRTHQVIVLADAMPN